MAKEEYMKVAPGISIVSKGIILDTGEKVTVKNFANEEVFESLKKSKKVVTEAEFLELQKELLNPDSESKKKDDESGKTGKQSDGQTNPDSESKKKDDESGKTGKQSDGQNAGAGA